MNSDSIIANSARRGQTEEMKCRNEIGQYSPISPTRGGSNITIIEAEVVNLLEQETEPKWMFHILHFSTEPGFIFSSLLVDGARSHPLAAEVLDDVRTRFVGVRSLDSTPFGHLTFSGSAARSN